MKAMNNAESMSNSRRAPVRFSIALKLAGVFAIVNIALLLLATIIASVMTTQVIREEAFKRLESDIAVTLHTFDYFKEDALASAKMVANTPRVVRFINSKQKDPSRLQEIKELLPPKQLIRIYDIEGNSLTGPNDLGVDKGLPLALAGESVTGVEPFEKGLAVRGIAPVTYNGNVIGAVMVGNRLDQAFADQIKRITNQEVGIAVGDSRIATWLAQTISVKGKPLSGELPHNVVDQARNTRRMIRENVEIEKHPYIATFAPLFGDYGEFVGLLFIGASQIPYQELARQSQLYIFSLALVGVLLATAIAILLSKTITDPLRQMVIQATRIAQGNLQERLTLKGGDELEHLADAFNQMSEALAIMKIRDQNANPLTKLPGNLTIEDEVQNRLNAGDMLAVLYTDLDHFKSFNDKFGFDRGDQVITLNADVIRDAVANVGMPEDFIGHIGGDDFIVVTIPDRAEEISKEIIRLFDERVPNLYSEADRKRGYIESTDRRGLLQRFPLCSISIAIVTNEQRKIKDFLELSSLAAEVKKFAKSLDGSAFARDRRTDRTTTQKLGPITEKLDEAP